MSSPIQRRIAVDRTRMLGIGSIVVAGLFLVVVGFAVIVDPTRLLNYLQLGSAAVFAFVGVRLLRRYRRDLAELEAEHGVGAGKQPIVR